MTMTNSKTNRRPRDGGKTLYHATMISDIEDGKIKYAGHSKPASRSDLYDKMNENGETVVIVLMNDYIG